MTDGVQQLNCDVTETPLVNDIYVGYVKSSI